MFCESVSMKSPKLHPCICPWILLANDLVLMAARQLGPFAFTFLTHALNSFRFSVMADFIVISVSTRSAVKFEEAFKSILESFSILAVWIALTNKFNGAFLTFKR